MNIHELSLEEKIGQMFMVGVMDEKHLEKMLLEYKVGGIIHFSRNGQTAKEAYHFFKKAKDLSRHPLIRSIDQEGGLVLRIKEGLTPISGNMAIGATGDYRNAKIVSRIMAYELMLLGANMNLAPVVDVNVNPNNPVINVRSFGENPDRVSEFSVAALKGYQEKGMLAVSKHFPGHGDTSIDSHYDLPMVAHDLERMHEVELKPFKSMIENQVDGIMVAHVIFNSIDCQRPATLSKKVITSLLRDTLAYEGLIMTDCMEMHAITNHFKPEEAVVESIMAGVDMVLYSSQIETQEACIKAVYKAVEDGSIREERIDMSVNRILKYKSKMFDKIQSWILVEPLLKEESHMKQSLEIAKASITITGDLPFDLKTCNQYCILNSKLLQSEFPQGIPYEKYNPKKMALIFYKTLSDLKELGHRLDKDRVVLVALNSPYEGIKGFTTIYTYELTSLSLTALKAILEGKSPRGILPISEDI